MHAAVRFSRLCVVVLLLAAGARAQSKAQERTFQAPPADVERALRSLQAYATAKLPTLYGFVTTQEPNLDRYSQGYYQFSITATPRASGETAVQVLAKITAWYSDDDGARSGYRELVSNGRLELDLLDRLGRSLGIPAPTRKESGSHHAPERAALESGRTPPASAATPSSSAFKTPVTLSESLPKRADLASLTAKNPDEQRIQQLRRQIASLEEVLRTQSRPTDLAAVRSASVPVYDQPLQTGKVLFEADAEDEYRVVEELGTWVHVQISGISRGWIERSNLEMPGANPVGGGGLTGAVDSGGPATTHEETSLFPGDWPRLRGRKVRILWIPTSAVSSANGSKWSAARSAFRRGLAGLTADGGEEGIVLVFDSADGGMAAAALPDLQRWIRGELTDEIFRRQCWLDPSDAF